jgi:5,6-dimethylbenzimidazole synthase
MIFSDRQAKELFAIMQHRRDVRGNNFLSSPIETLKLEMIIDAALAAPSVGFSQPWQFVIIDDETIKEDIYQNFIAENQKAKDIFREVELYNKLKLEGIKEAPINIAIFYEPSQEAVLGQTSMLMMGEYSVVCAIQNMWLMARALNIGMGWVSILDEAYVLKRLNAPTGYRLIAYLCLGYVDAFAAEPELETLGWKSRKARQSLLTKNTF